MNRMKKQQVLSPIEQALKTAREFFQGKEQKPYYNEKGFMVKPPPLQQGQEITDPRHNPFDVPADQENFMDNDDFKL